MSFLITELRNYINENFMNGIVTNTIPEDFVYENEVYDDADYKESFVETKDKPVIVSDKLYYYLDNDELTMEFGFDRDFSKQYKLCILLYRINKKTDKPFLQFYFENDNSTYRFPNKELLPDTFSAAFEGIKIVPMVNEEDEISELNELEDDENGVEDIFMENCNDLLKDIIEKDTEQVIYKGFLELDDTVYAVYDCSESTFYTKEDADDIWGITDEIVTKKAILNTPIDESIYNLFINNKIINSIRDSSRKVIPNPISVFLCKKDGDVYDNAYYPENESHKTSYSILNPKVSHDFFGNVYLFSMEKISFLGNISNIKRYALFIDGALNVPNKGIPIKDYKIADTDATPEYSNYRCINFYENESEYWLAKTSSIFAEL